MERKTKKKFIFVALLIMVLIMFIFGICTKISKNKIIIESDLKPGQKVVPVLYYEDRSSIGGDTYTFLVDGGEAALLEKHSRTFSKTYPLSAYDRFKENEAVYGEYGRLRAYYNSVDGEVFLFDSFVSAGDKKEYTIIKGDIKSTVPYDEFEIYHDFLYFDGNYYLFTLVDSGILRISKLSENLEIQDTFDIDYEAQGISGTDFIDNSFVIVEDTFFASAGGRLLRYDFNSGETNTVGVGYEIWGLTADNERFYVVGFGGNGEIIFEAFTAEGESVAKTTKALPFGLKYSPYTFSTGDDFYMYGSEIYCCFYYDGKTYFLSYCFESEEWTNYWIIEKEAEPFSPADIKFMIKEGEDYYDLFPHWSNG